MKFKGSLDGINIDYKDIYNWLFYEKFGLLKVDIIIVYFENSGFYYYVMLFIFIMDIFV